MKNQHISLLVRAGFVVTTILALWLGIQKYSEVMAVSNDCILAVLNVLFVFTLVYGASYVIYLVGTLGMPLLMARRAEAGETADVPFTKVRFNEMMAEEAKRAQSSSVRLMESIMAYSTLTFSKKLNSDQMDILQANIASLSEGKDASRSINTRLPGVTSNDLYHFGWNVGKRLKCSNIQIAWFLKDTFKAMLCDVSIETIQTKLAIKEGNFSLKLIPVDQELVPHIFPDTLEVESCLGITSN